MKILIVGYGSSGKRYHKILNKLYPNYIIKIFSVTNIKKKNNIFLKNHNEIIDYKPNISILSNPATLRFKFCKLLSKINSHLLIEKPLSSNLADANKILKLLKKNNIITKIAYNLRFLNSLGKLRSLLTKKIGRIYFIRVEVGQYLPTWRNILYTNSVSAKKIFGGGVLLELSHEIDYLLYLFGEFKSVFCKVQKISDLRIDVEDIANIILYNKKKFYINVSLDFCRKDKIRKFYISGKRGSLDLDLNSGNIKYYNKKNKWINISFSKQNTQETYQKVLVEFIRIVKNNTNKMKRPIKNCKLSSLQQGYEVLKIIAAAKKSSRVNRMIAL